MESRVLLSANEQFLKVLQTLDPSRARDLQRLRGQTDYASLWASAASCLDWTEDELTERLAGCLGIVRASALDVDRMVMNVMPIGFCQQSGMLPLKLDDAGLVVALCNPFDAEALERARFISGHTLVPRLASPMAVADATALAYSLNAREEMSEVAADTAATREPLDELMPDHAIVKFARELMRQAILLRASDLHIQPHIGSMLVRVRVDGKLRRLTTCSASVGATLIRHFKARAGMDSTNAKVPQDGRMSRQIDGRDFDLRLSVLPANQGERLVIRFLDQSKVVRLANSRFSLAALQSLRRVTAQPSGLLIFTGPTGSGKTSSLYAMLGELNRSTVNIITVENPVEYRLAGISQVEVNERAGTTFASALRSILRQDPDVVLIGEVRDPETAEIAVQAAMTGHLVLTTLHTNDALSAIPRLINLGIQPSILADALAAVVSQRLCRSLCPQCKAPVTEPLRPDEALFQQATRTLPAYRAVGCAMCEQTGYHGRLPIVEILENSANLRTAIADGRTNLDELEAVREGGLRRLSVSGALRVISGETTVTEVMDAVGRSFWPELAAHYGTDFTLDDAAFQPLLAGASPGVLLIGRHSPMAGPLAAELGDLGLRLVETRTADEAAQALRIDEELVFVVLDFGDCQDVTQLQADLAQARRLGAWARLPALVLMHRSLLEQEGALRAVGMTAEVLPADSPAAEVIKAMRRSQVR